MNNQRSPEHARSGQGQSRRRRTGTGTGTGTGLAMTRRVVATLLASIAATSAAAERAACAPMDEDWHFAVAPYFWAAGTKGTTGTLPGLPLADVDMSFGDVFDDLKPSGMLFFTANKGRLGFATDHQYVETETQSHGLQPLFNDETVRSTGLVFSALVNYL